MSKTMTDQEERLRLLEREIERRLQERFNALRAEFDRMRLEADRRWAGFLERFDQDLSGIVPAELIAEPAPTPAAPQPGRVSLEAVRGIDEAANQVEALHRFLDECRQFASRVALLVARGDTVTVWKAVGFSDHGQDDQAARQIALPASDFAPLSQVMLGTPLLLKGANAISSRFGVSDVAEAILVPMSVKEKVSGVVYADAAPAQAPTFDPDAIALLTFLAGLAVDRLALRKLRPVPALRPFEVVEEPSAAPPIEEAPAPTPEEELPPAAEMSEDTAPRQEAPELPPPPPPPVQPPAIAREDFGFEGEAAAAAPPPPEPVPPEPVPPEPVPPEPVPPAPAPQPARRLAGPLAPAEGDERREEARRFARLLVSEIKLYNERAVLEGRRTGNLYERLREDIDRSRQMYDERIPEDVRAKTNYFYEELVEVLAEGRPEALGM
jgi:hypothetical protein